MLHIFYLEVINILTHVFGIPEKERGGGPKEGLKTTNSLICEKQIKSKTRVFKAFLNFVSRLFVYI